MNADILVISRPCDRVKKKKKKLIMGERDGGIKNVVGCQSLRYRTSYK